MGEGGFADGRKWHHAFALKGFPVLDAIMKTGEFNNVINKTIVFYYEVSILDEKPLDRYQ
jgi:hypothetical protein